VVWGEKENNKIDIVNPRSQRIKKKKASPKRIKKKENKKNYPKKDVKKGGERRPNTPPGEDNIKRGKKKKNYFCFTGTTYEKGSKKIPRGGKSSIKNGRPMGGGDKCTVPKGGKKKGCEKGGCWKVEGGKTRSRRGWEFSPRRSGKHAETKSRVKNLLGGGGGHRRPNAFFF